MVFTPPERLQKKIKRKISNKCGTLWQWNWNKTRKKWNWLTSLHRYYQEINLCMHILLFIIILMLYNIFCVWAKKHQIVSSINPSQPQWPWDLSSFTLTNTLIMGCEEEETNMGWCYKKNRGKNKECLFMEFLDVKLMITDMLISNFTTEISSCGIFYTRIFPCNGLHASRTDESCLW